MVNYGGTTTLAEPVYRRPGWRNSAAYFSQIFASGHGWAASGAGVGSSSPNDTSTFIKGTQCFTVTTAGNGSQANISKTAMTAFDMTGKALRLTFKVDSVTHLNQIKFYVGTSAFTNYFNWIVHTHSGSAQNIVQSGEWVSLTIPWASVSAASGSFSISANGVPSVTTGFTDMEFAVFDDGAGAVTLHLQSVEIIQDTATTFPGGVISITFDDSFQNAYDNGRPLLDTYGYRATLYTIAQNIGAPQYQTLAELQTLQAMSGWEIAGHAYSSSAHAAGYNTLTASQVASEFRLMRQWMNSNGFNGDHFAYPQGAFSATTDNVPVDQICGEFFSTGRSIISETAETWKPAMPYRLRSKTGISSSGTPVSVITQAGGVLDRCQLDSSWFIITLHQIVTSGVTASTMLLQSDLSTLLAAINSRGIPVLPVGEVISLYS